MQTLEDHLAMHWQVKGGGNKTWISVFYDKRLCSLYLIISNIRIYDFKDIRDLCLGAHLEQEDKRSFWRRWSRFYSSWEEGEWQWELMKATVRFSEQHLREMKVKEESGKADLKLSIQKTKIMASCHISSWQKGGEKMKTVTDFIFLGSKITLDSDCRHEIKRCLLLGRKAMTNLDSI